MTSEALYNNEAEALVLAAMLRYPEEFYAINHVGLTKDDFLGPENRRVAKAVFETVAEKQRPELPYVLEALRLAGDDSTGEYVAGLSSLPASVEQASGYAATVKGLAVSRHITRAGARIIEIGREHRSDYESAIVDAESALRAVSDILPEAERSPRPQDIIRRITSAGPSDTIPLLFAPTLSQITGGLQRGNLWVIGGFSSTGKSAVGCNIVLDALAVRGKKVAIVSTEMTQEQYMIRLLSISSGVPQQDIRNGVIRGIENQENLAAATRKLEKSPLFIFDAYYKWAKIKNLLHRIHDQEGLDVVVLDYIQNIRISGDVYGDARDVAVESLQLAKDLQCTVVAFSQVSNAMANQDIQEKGQGEFYTFKGAGDIRDSADVAVMLRRNRKEQSPILHFDIAKNRHGALKKFDTEITLNTGRIEEVDSVYEDPD